MKLSALCRDLLAFLAVGAFILGLNALAAGFTI